MDIYSIIEKWNLDKAELDFGRYSRRSIAKLAHEIQTCYSSLPKAGYGRNHLSLYTSTSIVEGGLPIEKLSIPLILSNQLYLPDPLFSIFSPLANSIWHKLPESGCTSFTGKQLIHIDWNNFWSTKISDRIKYLNVAVPPLVQRLKAVQPLVEKKIIILFPWEVIVDHDFHEIKKSVLELTRNESILKEITEKFPQIQYNLGVRIGSLGLELGEDSPSHGLKKGAHAWLGDKTEVVLNGVLHSLISSKLASNFIDSKPGDRVVHDYIRTGGAIGLSRDVVVNSVKVPNFEMALWEDLTAIKKDSELINEFSELITNTAYASDDSQYEIIKDRLTEIEQKMREDSSIKKILKLPTFELSLGMCSGIAANIVAGAGLAGAAGAAGMTAGSAFLFKLVSDYYKQEEKDKRARRDLIIKVNGKI
ncbi:hypothetical protein ACK30C_15005 [Aeromonas caviae]